MNCLPCHAAAAVGCSPGPGCALALSSLPLPVRTPRSKWPARRRPSPRHAASTGATATALLSVRRPRPALPGTRRPARPVARAARHPFKTCMAPRWVSRSALACLAQQLRGWDCAGVVAVGARCTCFRQGVPADVRLLPATRLKGKANPPILLVDGYNFLHRWERTHAAMALHHQQAGALPGTLDDARTALLRWVHACLASQYVVALSGKKLLAAARWNPCLLFPDGKNVCADTYARVSTQARTCTHPCAHNHANVTRRTHPKCLHAPRTGRWASTVNFAACAWSSCLTEWEARRLARWATTRARARYLIAPSRLSTAPTVRPTRGSRARYGI